MAPTKPCSPMRRMGATDKAVKPPENLQHMHGMLNKMIVMRSRCLFAWYLRLITMPCPKFGAKSGLTQHVVVGRCCLGLKSSMRNMRPGDQDSFMGVPVTVMQVCGHQVLPGARSGANVWRLGYYFFTTAALTATVIEQICCCPAYS